ncbi:MAG: hypothetical protein AAF645_18850, partial [Myxococcota bacterium]
MVIGKRISRRMLLAGTGGLAVSLPMLEAMVPRGAKAQGGGPKRYVVALQGISQPRANGRNDAMFDPLRADGVDGDVSVIKGISLGTSGPASRSGAFHKSVISPMMAGVSTPTTGGAIQAISSDQVVAQAFAGLTPHASLRLSTQTRPTGARNGYEGRGKGANMS